MASVVTFGEIMMRLTAPGLQRFGQADHLRITYGGGEANVAAALAQIGVPAAHATIFPNNDLGRAAAAFDEWACSAGLFWGTWEPFSAVETATTLTKSTQVDFVMVGAT